jgi:serine/threonine protein kinase
MAENPLRAIGKYEILSELGKGSMGTVYKARDPTLDRVVALKTILPGAVLDAEARERFLREARSVARLQHPNIITIFEMGEMERVPFIAMEFLEGESLADAAEIGRPAGVEAKLRVVEQLCRGLGYAHGRGVVHRDVKPTNIFLLPDGTAKVLDFGVAWLEGGTFATRTGMLLGTPAYMAPEQFSGGDVDHRVDMWAVGVILYEMLTGERPFEAETVPSLIYKIVHTQHQAIDPVADGVPIAVVQIVTRALQKNPKDRFADLDEMSRAVRAALDEDGVEPQVTRAEDTEGDRHAPVPPGKPTAALDEAKTRLHSGTFRYGGVLADTGPLHVISASPDERVLAIGGVDGSIRLWDLENRVSLRTLRSRAHLKSGHSALTTSLAFVEDGTVLATGHLDGSISIWDPETGFEMDAQLRHDGTVGGLAFVPGRSLLISGGHDESLKYWDLSAVLGGDARRELRRQPAAVTALTVSADGRLAVTGHSNLNLRGHDIASGRLVATFHGLEAVPSVLRLSPDGGLLACGCRNGSIRLFRVEGRAQLRHFEAHSKTVSSLVFFPDGRHLASVAMDQEVAIWSVSYEDRLATLSAGSGASCASVAVLAGSRRLVCGLAGGQIRVWDYD